MLLKSWQKCIAVGSLALILKVQGADLAVQDIEFNKTVKMPWFSGTLISPGGYVVPKGHYNLQPYFYWAHIDGQYDARWKFQKQDATDIATIIIPFKMGIGSGFDWGITPAFYGRYHMDQKHYGVTDWVIGASYQILDAELTDPYPGIKLIFKSVIPLGKYQHLDPKKKRTDVAGDGNWWPTLGFGFSKLWSLGNSYFFELNGGILYFFSTPVWVNGYNTYGGYKNTHAKVYNGNVTGYNLSFEVNLSQRWGFTCDFLYKHKNSTTYKGNPGVLPNGKRLSLKSPSNENISISPAFQYNFNANMGIIAGFWFSVAGRNTSHFRNGVLTFNLYI
jgi:hypothetical protein